MRLRILVACFSVLPLMAKADASGLEFFEKKIRPLLAEQCYECHSPEKKVKGGLALDSKEGWQKGGDSGPAIVPGDPDKSLLIKAVRYTDEDIQMPPKRKLSAAQMADLEQWVKMGAPDPRTGKAASTSASAAGMSVEEGRKFWAYQLPKKPVRPTVKENAWPKADLDYFILSELETKGLQPNPAADKLTLARRAYFDLTGLPPTHEQLEAFLKDSSPNAYPSLVDSLLASARFGEHWGRHWLDVVRYAESVTLRGLIFKEAWRYRDYVIDAFNGDMPYNQFVKEQLAGDLLPHKTVAQRRKQLIATTFLQLGNTNLEEQDKKQLDMDVVDEQLDTLGKAFLSQTIGCARCHDHKFDPIPTRDYYAMAGILKNSKALKHANVSGWVEVPLPVDPEQEAILQKHESAIAKLQADLKQAKDAAKALAGTSGEAKSEAKKQIVSSKDLRGIVVDSAQAKAVGTWQHSTHSKHYIGDGYWHDANKEKGEKTLTFMPELTKPGKYEVRLAYIHSPSRADNVPVTVFHADGETTVHVNQQEAPVLDGRFVSLGQFRFEGNGFGYALISTEGTKGFVTADAVQFLPAEMVETIAKSSGSSVSEKQNFSAEIKTLEEKIKALQESGPKRPMTMSLLEEGKFEDIPVHIRGSVHNLGPKVPRGFLTVAHNGQTPAMPANASGRAELADWIASPSNPLTARIYANRVWLWLTGEGLVRTPDNFGTTGEKPSHPELLDYLAVRLMEEGWSTKKLIREIMLSRAYQLSTANSAASSKLDPENRLYWRMNRRRLNAESIRDSILLASGKLELETGGVTFPLNRSADYGFEYQGNRRSVYVPVFRNALPDIFEVFDFAPHSMVTGKRSNSTVPTQGLYLLNNPFVREQATNAAKQLLSAVPGDSKTRLEHAYRITLTRPPSAREMELAEKHLSSFGVSEQLQAWTELYHALFACLDFRYIN